MTAERLLLAYAAGGYLMLGLLAAALLERATRRWRGRSA